jgi:hypothetical protein
MPKETKASGEAEVALTLTEFCSRKSLGDRRVELIGAFHSDEVRKGRVKDVTSAFEARFEEFANKPV